MDSRLEVVDLPRGCESEDPADEVTKQDNMSTIGALFWLASQSRPDIQAAVSLAQRKQRGPSFQDVKETNKAVKMAQAGKTEQLCYQKLPGFGAPSVPRCSLGQRHYGSGEG